MIRANVTLPQWVWGVVIAGALLTALGLAGWLSVGWIADRARAKTLAEGAALAQRTAARADTLARSLDSARRIVATVETVVVAQVARARREATAPIPPAADTTGLVAAVRSCRAQLDTLAGDCDAFRVAATTAMARADSVDRAKDDVIRGFSVALAAGRQQDSIRAARARRWAPARWAAIGGCSAAVATHLFQWSK